MHVLITGSAGFLGQRLARTLLSRGTLTDSDAHERPIERLVLLDTVQPFPAPDDPRVRVMTGDVADRGLLEEAIDEDTASIFHLAAVVSGGAEADFELGMHVNLRATELLLEICRLRRRRPKLVFTSSVAVYGGPLPDRVDDLTILTPQSSYGTQKAIGELLINDYSRRGFVDGRSLRLPTISVRPGRPNLALSSFASGIIREPLNGESTVCPVPPDTRLWLLSPARVLECLLLAHELAAATLAGNRSLILPGISVTTGEMVAALGRVAGPEVAARVRFDPNPVVERVARTWPGALDDSRARALGFPSDRSFDDIIRQYIANDWPRPLVGSPPGAAGPAG
jgi:nucleoside-diphosphate-sugar epimerase